jgi:hypothetical protein
MNMQGDYYAFNQGAPQQQPPPQMQAAYTYGGFLPFGYPIGQTLPTHKHLEKLKRNKKNTDVGRSGSNKSEEITNSTDESIHLVRSRKTGGILNHKHLILTLILII